MALEDIFKQNFKGSNIIENDIEEILNNFKRILLLEKENITLNGEPISSNVIEALNISMDYVLDLAKKGN